MVKSLKVAVVTVLLHFDMIQNLLMVFKYRIDCKHHSASNNLYMNFSEILFWS